jgi:hypothetical protein
MTQDIKKDFSNALKVQAEQMHTASFEDRKNGHWIRAAVVTMNWVAGKASELDDLNIQSVQTILEQEMQNEQVRRYALDGFKKVFQQLSI